MKVEDAFEIDAPRWTIWKVLIDPSYIPKLFPEIITAEMEPPGEITAGSRTKVYGKIGKIRFEIYLEFPRVENEVCLMSRQLPGGLFQLFSQAVFLEAVGMQTRVKTSFEFALGARVRREGYRCRALREDGHQQSPRVRPKPEGNLRAAPAPQLERSRRRVSRPNGHGIYALNRGAWPVRHRSEASPFRHSRT